MVDISWPSLLKQEWNIDALLKVNLMLNSGATMTLLEKKKTYIKDQFDKKSHYLSLNLWKTASVIATLREI